MTFSIVEDLGYNGSSCGYCGQDSDTSKSTGMWGHQLGVTDYDALISRGWRRCGYYLYKPDLKQSCCPCYTIRLTAANFKPSKSQRKVANRAYRWLYGERHEPGAPHGENPQGNGSPPSPHGQKRKQRTPIKDVHWDSIFKEAFHGGCGSAHTLEIKMVKAEVTPENYALYKKYQMVIHNDPEDKVTEKGYRRFLVDSCLMGARGSGGNKGSSSTSIEAGYGTFHQNYFLDGKLVIVTVVDLLPSGQSSVYSFYDPDYNFLAPGVLSGLGEIYHVQELTKQDPDFKYFYLGFYIHNCQKMKYKADFKPSQLLCPETYTYVDFASISKKLDASPYSKLGDGDEESDAYVMEQRGNTLLFDDRNLKTYDMFLAEAARAKVGAGNNQAMLDAVATLDKQYMTKLAAWRRAVGPELSSRIVYIAASLSRDDLS